MPLARSQRLLVIIAISLSFFILEIVVGFRNHSLALVADAFHVSNDLIGFVIAYIAVRKGSESRSGPTSDKSSRSPTPSGLSFGWQRAELVGAFFNGVFLLALGVSILLQSIERFIQPQHVKDPTLIIIVGAVGIGLNMISAVTVHEHGHGGHSHSHGPQTENAAHELAYRMTGPDPHADHAHTSATRHRKAQSHRDLGMLSVFLHLLGDAFNNLLVILSAVVFLTTSHRGPHGQRMGGFVYADPIASTLVGFMILLTAVPLVKRTGLIMLEGAPMEVDIKGVESDVMRVDGVEGVHEMHVWSLTQSKALATLHVATSDDSLSRFMATAKQISECLHHWNIHNLTIQPELVAPPYTTRANTAPGTPPNPDTEEVLNGPSLDAASLACRLRCPGTQANEGCDKEPCCD